MPAARHFAQRGFRLLRQHFRGLPSADPAIQRPHLSIRPIRAFDCGISSLELFLIAATVFAARPTARLPFLAAWMQSLGDSRVTAPVTVLSPAAGKPGQCRHR
jgi:hypothetical protein